MSHLTQSHGTDILSEHTAGELKNREETKSLPTHYHLVSVTTWHMGCMYFQSCVKRIAIMENI